MSANWRLVFALGVALSLFERSCLAAETAPPDATAPKTPSFYKEIRPIFQANCQGCHQPAKRQGGYDLTTPAAIALAGESEQAAVVPGHPEQSHLISQITPKDGKAEMPKDHDPLNADQIAKITAWIAAGATNDTPASLVVAVDMRHPPQYAAPPVITSLDFSPDDSLLAVSGYHETLLYKADGSEVVARLVGQAERIEAVAFSPDGKSLAVAGGSPGRLGELQIWDVAKRELRLAITVTYDTLYGASWSHDGTKVAFGCGDNTVRAIDAATGKQVFYQGAHSDWVLDTVFSNDSTYLISVSRDRSVKLHEIATQRFVDNITSITPGALKGGLEAVARRPGKDELLIGGADGTPRLYKMIRTQARVIGDDFNLLRAYEAMPGRIYDVDFNANGSRIACGSSLDGGGEIRIADAENAQTLQKLPVPSGVFAVAFSSSGAVLAAAGFDGVVRLFDSTSGKPIKEFAVMMTTKQ